MIPNGEKCKAWFYEREAKSERQKWPYLAVKRTIDIIKRNDF